MKLTNNNFAHAGSTVVSVLVRNNQLFWNSVGDSRAYLLRDNEFVQFTLDHSYKTVLDERKKAGIIDEEKYCQEIKNADALINFLGIGKLKLQDYNDKPLALKSNDKIILMSDGLYKLLTDDEIARILINFSYGPDALKALEIKAHKNAELNNLSRDNMTIALIKIK